MFPLYILTLRHYIHIPSYLTFTFEACIVRAFDVTRKNKTVGFLDDMRRLNVALSRAKKKLIIIGNLSTLCSDNAHFKPNDSCEIIPVNVFRKLKEIKERSADTNYQKNIKILMQEK